MMYLFLLIFSWLHGTVAPKAIAHTELGKGGQPAAATDLAGTAHIVFGRGDVLYYTTSRTGEKFNALVRVDSLPGLQLGATRGPQIAVNRAAVVITALDKSGNIWAYTQDRSTGKWQSPVAVNDVPAIAKEGFIAITAGPDNIFTAAWLDLRGNKRNKLVGARSVDGGRTWSANKLLYQSPDGTICECCQVSAVSRGSHIAFMFRNFLNGSRDMYLLQSTDGGQSFGAAEKLGEGTWKLNACPMDGGGLAISPDGQLSTVWRRADKLFTARPGQPETELATGKNPKIASTPKGDYIVYQQAGQLLAVTPDQTLPRVLGSGGYANLVRLASNRVLCLWEQDGSILAAVI